MKAMPPDQAERDRIRNDLETNYLVEASAGTGKTFELVARMIALVATGVPVAEMAAITFTKEASAELRQRFQIELEKAVRMETLPSSREHLTDAVSRIDACFIGTIHAFCAELLRERPVEANLSPGFQELEDENPELVELRDRIWRENLKAGESGESAAAGDVLDLGLELNDLKPSYETVCKFPEVDFRALAEAEESPAAELQEARKTVDALLDEMVPRLRSETGIGYILDPLERSLMDRSQLRDGPLENAEFLWRFGSSIRDSDSNRRNAVGAEAEARAIQVRDEIAGRALEKWRCFLYPKAMAFVVGAAQEFKRRRRERGLLSFTDLLVYARDMLRNNPSVREDLAKRFPRILVDEFQDTDPIQAEVLLYLTGTNVYEEDWTKLKIRRGSLFVVGDPKQAIFRFRRADLAIYQRFKELFLRHGREVRLSANFRSLPAICDAVNREFAGVFVGNGTDIQAPAATLEPTRGAVPGRVLRRLVVETSGREGPGAAAQKHARSVAEFIASEIALSNRKPGDFLLLARKRVGLADYRSELERRDIPAEIRTGRESSDREFMPAGLLGFVTLLEAAAVPSDPVATMGFLRSALCGASDEELFRFHEAGGLFDAFKTPPLGIAGSIAAGLSFVREVIKAAADLTPAAAVSFIADRSGLFASAAAAPAADSSAGLALRAVTLARRLSAEGFSFHEIVKELASLIREAQISAMSLAPDVDAVRLMTIHSAKGLEAPVVILVDPGREDEPPEPDRRIDRGSVPRGFLRVFRQSGIGSYAPKIVLAEPAGWRAMADAELRADRAQSQRLDYVAATRARDLLVVGINRHTTRGGGNRLRGQWEFMDSFLEDDLPASGASFISSTPEPINLPAEFELAGVGIEARKASLRRTTYRIEAVTRSREEAGGVLGAAAEAGRGAAFGRVLHKVLETMMRRDDVELSVLVARLLSEEELPPTNLDEVVRIASAIRGSELWNRAKRADECFVEVPFAVPLTDEGGPGILRGAMDLVFREKSEWRIVDYKSDRIGAGRLEALIERYRPQVEAYRREWEKFTGATTRSGLFFLDADEVNWL